jgi:hypothetical protein
MKYEKYLTEGTEGASLSKSDMDKFGDIIKRLVLANFKQHKDLLRAKDQAFNRLMKDAPEVLNAYIKQAMKKNIEL